MPTSSIFLVLLHCGTHFHVGCAQPGWTTPTCDNGVFLVVDKHLFMGDSGQAKYLYRIWHFLCDPTTYGFIFDIQELMTQSLGSLYTIYACCLSSPHLVWYFLKFWKIIWICWIISAPHMTNELTPSRIFQCHHPMAGSPRTKCSCCSTALL